MLIRNVFVDLIIQEKHERRKASDGDRKMSPFDSGAFSTLTRILHTLCALYMLCDYTWKSLREILEVTSEIHFCQHQNCYLFSPLTHHGVGSMISGTLKAALKSLTHWPAMGLSCDNGIIPYGLLVEL